jgi:hypothetical protein
MAVATLSTATEAAEPSAGARVNNLKVLSDKIDDVTTVGNILKSFVKPGMSDAERSKAIWTAAVKYRHQTTPPDEQLSADWETHDPVKIFNTYGYCMCCCCSAIVEALNREDGRQSRGRILNGHSVPEVFYANGWHMYDCSLITIFPKPGSGAIASVDEISEAVKGWYAKNPGYKGNGAKIDELMRSDGWTGWKSKGPELLSNCPYYNLGWFPAKTHGWNATMAEYDRKCEVYEYGYQIGHRALFSLRPGESFVREAGNRPLDRRMHINGGQNWDMLWAKAPQNDLVYLKEFLPGYNGGVVGNGYHRYAPNLAAGELALGADTYENLEHGASPALRVKSANKRGVAIVQLASPYVYLGGRVRLKTVRMTDADKITVSLSTNNGLTYRPFWGSVKLGVDEVSFSLGDIPAPGAPHGPGPMTRRYAYWLKIEITSSSPESAGLESFSVENDIQHAPRTLPWLGKGNNTITVAADTDTGLATRTIACRITADAAFAKNETTSSMGVVFDNLDVKDGGCWWKGGTGTMMVPIDVPGDLVGLRFGAQVRARSERDLIKMLLSFDEGKTWKEAAKIAGPTPGFTQYFRFTDIPAGTKKALLRYELTGNNTVGIFSFRVDADYKDPLAAKAFRPFTVVHRWKEADQEKTHRETIAKLPATYTIKTEAEAVMVSVTYEMAAK